ncbi:hypothetical protein HRI_001067000 [Hibiscus trionum]|uniref:RRM domain-containing protein n=1 Tax=Hibiscus trionum TaxID=183268 RepID=A0A9W7HBG7_HIBTR|nr:hypothetical protein HRI_001067000 [Hibiscus trionum]
MEAKGPDSLWRKKANAASEEWIIFVDNLSRRVSRGTLREFFERFGKVVRVFIPAVNKRPKYWNCTFAFIHFAEEGGMKKAIERVDNSLIDGRVVRVSVSRFKKGQRSGHQTGGNHSSTTPKGSRVNKRFASSYRHKDDRSFKEALLSRSPGRQVPSHEAVSPDGEAEADFNVEPPQDPRVDMGWIKASAMGILKPGFDVDFVQKALANDGIRVNVAKWGCLPEACLVTFASQESKTATWLDKKEELSFWFSHIEEDVLIEGIPCMYVPVKLEGFPLHCWSSVFFTFLANKWGRLVEIHEATIKKFDLSSVRFLIRAHNQFVVPNFITFLANDQNFRVKVSTGEWPSDHLFDMDGSFGDQEGDELSEDQWADAAEVPDIVIPPVDNPIREHERSSLDPVHGGHVNGSSVAPLGNVPNNEAQAFTESRVPLVNRVEENGVGAFGSFHEGASEASLVPPLDPNPENEPVGVIVSGPLSGQAHLVLDDSSFVVNQHQGVLSGDNNPTNSPASDLSLSSAGIQDIVSDTPDRCFGSDRPQLPVPSVPSPQERLFNKSVCPLFPQAVIPGTVGGDFFKASHRRVIRRHVRESLDKEFDSASKDSSNSGGSIHLSYIEEALHIWGVSKVLGITFRGNKEEVVENFRVLEGRF